MLQLIRDAIAALRTLFPGNGLHDYDLPLLDEWDGTPNGQTYRARPGELVINGRVRTAEGYWVPVDDQRASAGELPWSVVDLTDDQVLWPWGITDRWGVVIARLDDQGTAELVVQAANK